MSGRRALVAALLACIVTIGVTACSSNSSSDNSGAVTDLDKLGPDVAKLRIEVQQLRQEVRALQEQVAKLQPSSTDTTTTTVPAR